MGRDMRGEFATWRTRLGDPGSPLRGAVWAASGLAASTVAGLAASAFLVAVSSVDVFADMAVLVIAILFFSTLFRFGADSVFLGEVLAAEKDGHNEAENRAASLTEFALLSGVVGGALAAAGILFAPVEPALSAPLTQTERVLLGAWLLAETVRFVLAESYRWLHRFGWATFAGAGARMSIYFILLLIVSLRGPLGRQEAILAAAAASVGVCLTAMIPLARILPWMRGSPIHSFRRAWRGHSSMFATTLCATLVGGADLYIVAYWFGPDTTARYSFAVTLCAGITAIGTSVVFGVAPRLAHYIHSLQPIQTEMLATRTVRTSSMLGLGAWCVLLLLGEPISVFLGGEEYAGITPLIAILGGGQVLALVAGLGGTALILAQRYWVIALLSGAAAFLLIAVGSGIAYLNYSVLLVAVVSSSALLVLKLGAAYVAKRLLGIRFDGFRIKRVLAAGQG